MVNLIFRLVTRYFNYQANPDVINPFTLRHAQCRQRITAKYKKAFPSMIRSGEVQIVHLLL